MTDTIPGLAVVGRRVEFAYKRAPDVYLPGIITAVTDDEASLRIRLDGKRSLLAIWPDYEGLRYLDQVVPVPDLPMGRFTPALADLGGFEWEGVPVFEIEEDVVVALTWERRKAAAAMTAYFVLVLGIHDTPITGATPGLRYGIGLFEWEPEDADMPWTMRLGKQGDDQAIPLHYLHT